VGKREVGRELVWCRVVIQAERVVLGFSFVPRFWRVEAYRISRGISFGDWSRDWVLLLPKKPDRRIGGFSLIRQLESQRLSQLTKVKRREQPKSQNPP